MIVSLQAVLLALLGGIVPAIIWLVFWLKEDSARPEPRGLILRTFLLGMLSVLLVIPLEQWAFRIYPDLTISTFFCWALIEESFKLLAAYYGGLRSVEDDEPIDAMMYMITAALGFAALENALFIFGPLLANNVPSTIIAGNLRFIGASLLHIVSSGAIGAALALTFYKPKWQRMGLLVLTLGLAVAFHTDFNLFVSDNNDVRAVVAFGAVWVGITILLLLFEKVKSIAR